MELKDALETAIKVVRGEPHKWHGRTVELRKLYTAIATGEHMEDLIKKYFPDSSDQEVEKIINLTNITTPSTFYKMEKPIAKSLRSDIKHEFNAEQGFIDATNNFYGKRPIRKFMDTRWTKTTLLDPNAFELIDWKSFDNVKEKANPYPVLIACDHIFDFKYENKDLIWVTVHDQEADKRKWTFYAKGLAIVITPKKKDKSDIEVDPRVQEIFSVSDTDALRDYNFEILETNLESINLKRVGFIEDPSSNNETCVSMFHPSMPQLRSMIKSCSEVDFGVHRYLFPRYRHFVPMCEGAPDDICDKEGCNKAGETCKVCNGTKKRKKLTSGKDVEEYEAPRDLRDLGEIDLAKLYDIEEYQSDLMQDMIQRVKDLDTEALRVVYTTSNQRASEVTKTATQVVKDYEDYSDALNPFTIAYSDFMLWHWNTIADIRDDTVTDMVFMFPQDLKLATKMELIAEYKEMPEEAEFLRKNQLIRIARKDFAGSDVELKKTLVKLDFKPFSGKSEQTVRMLISSNSVRELDKILWMYYDRIWRDIEMVNPDVCDAKNLQEILDTAAEKYLPTPNTTEPIGGLA